MVAAVWVLVFFSVLAVGVSRGITSRMEFFRRVEAWWVSTSLMRSLVLYTQTELKAMSTVADKNRMLWQPREKELGIAKAVYVLSDESGLVDINNFSETAIAGLPGMGPDLARDIVNSSRRPFSVREELFLVDGFGREAMDKAGDLFTVYGKGRLNINSASRDVLEAMGFDASLAMAVTDLRNGPDRQPGTQDDVFFESTSDIIATLQDRSALSEPQKVMLAGLLNNGFLTVEPGHIMIKAQTYVLGKKDHEYEIVIGADKVLRWRER